MEVHYIQSTEVYSQAGSKEERQKWAEEHARRMQHLFEQWQKPLGIEGGKYCEHLTDDLFNLCDDPLLKSLIESID